MYVPYCSLNTWPTYIEEKHFASCKFHSKCYGTQVGTYVSSIYINVHCVWVKNLKTFTGYTQLKTSSFRLSGYSLQWIKNGKWRATINTKIGEIIKRIY